MATRKSSNIVPANSDELSLEDHLKDLIARGLLAPGQRVTEAEVMEERGASRSRVRQAFQRLAVEGIMIIEEFRGASVKRLSAAEIVQLYEAREVIEGLAARLAATQCSVGLKAQLTRLMAQLKACEKSGDWLLFTQLNNQWHQQIIDHCANAYVMGLMGRLNVPLHRLLIKHFLKPQEIAQANKDHGEITEAIIAGAAETAEKLMRRHVRSAFKKGRERMAPDAA